MVVRSPFRCLTCGENFALRIGVGHEDTQRHFFLCPHCGEECSISIDIDFTIPDLRLVESDNCSRLEEIDVHSTQSWRVVNLHPDYVVPFDQKNKDNVFPWLNDGRRMFERLRQYHDARSRFADLRALLNFNDSLSGKWKILGRALKLHLNDQSKLCSKVLHHYKWIFATRGKGVFQALRDFSRGMLFPARIPRLNEYEGFVTELNIQHPERFESFLKYWRKNLFLQHLGNYVQIFDDYFRDYSEYKQTLNYIRCGVRLPEGSYASSRGFNRVRMFYGNAFEVLTSHFVIPACLNNICNDREYDKFEKMDLSLYVTIDKSNRGNPFKNNERLNFLLEGIDTHVRNASHHADIRLLKGRDILEYRSGKSGNTRTMTYAKYIHLCNMLLTNLFTMFSIELRLRQL